MANAKLKKFEKIKIESELDYLMSLTVKQRFDLMFKKSREMAKKLKKKNHKTIIIKRKIDR